jgi:hypothetical protein
MLAGTKIKIGDKELVVPPISLGQLRNGTLTLLKQHDDLVAEGKTFDAMIIRGEVILSALHRNYPDFPEDELYAYLDMSNVGPLWLTILGASGFMPGEGTAAVETAQPGTSGPSTEV